MANLALMFPGQGSQAVGMGCDLCAADPLMRDTYAEASAVSYTHLTLPTIYSV